MPAPPWTFWCLVNNDIQHAKLGPVIECPHCKAPNVDLYRSRSEGLEQNSQPAVGKSTSTAFVIDDEDQPQQTGTTTTIANSANNARTHADGIKAKALADSKRTEALAKANKAVNLHASHAGGFLKSTNKLAQSATQAKDDRLKHESNYGVGVLVTVVESSERWIFTADQEVSEIEILSKEQVGQFIE